MRCGRGRAAGALTALGVALFVGCAGPGQRPPRPAPTPGATSGAAARGAVQASPGGDYAWPLPPGFPPPAVPPDNPMSADKVELGRRLFFDRRLSGNGTLSCAGCHRPELAFTDGRAGAVGSTGERHRRSSMSLVNVAYNVSFNWANPDVVTLEQQMLVPLFNTHPVELGLAGRGPQVLQRLAAAGYRDDFRAAFPGAAPALDLGNVIRAIAAFERTLLFAGSPYDRYVFWGDEEALSPVARRGMELFFSERLGCGGCHGGFNLSGPVRTAAGEAPAELHHTGLYNLDGRGAYPESDRGALEVTGRPEDMGRFRAPTLRNVALTAPYMHDGSLATLDAVVDHYAAGGRGGEPNPLKSPRLAGFELAPGERQALLAFLDSLTDPGL